MFSQWRRRAAIARLHEASRGLIEQRGHARHAAHWAALSRCGAAPQASPLRVDRRAGCSASGSRCATPNPSEGSSQCFASASQRAGARSWCRLAGASCWALRWPAAPSCRPSSPQPGASRWGLAVQHHGFSLIDVPGVQPVATAGYRHCQGTPGFAGSQPAAQSCRPPGPHKGASRRWPGRRHHCFAVCTGRSVQSAGTAGYRHAGGARSPGSLRIVPGWGWIGRRAGIHSAGHTLRFYILPHCPQCRPVARKLPWWPSPLRALRVKATANMQSAPRCSGRVSHRRYPSPLRVLRADVCRPWGVRASGFQSGASRGVSGQWPAAMRLVCAPPTPGLARSAGIGPAAWPVRPRGAPFRAAGDRGGAGRCPLGCSCPGRPIGLWPVPGLQRQKPGPGPGFVIFHLSNSG